MGKGEEDEVVPGSAADEAQGIEQNVEHRSDGRVCRRFRSGVSFRCVFSLLFGVGVLVSALFWLPFFRFGDQKDLDLDSEFGGHAMVASFMVYKTASFLEDYALQLQDDIFEEISFPTTKVEVLKLESSGGGSNTTTVIFVVDSDVTTQSLIRESFVSLIIHQSSLHLTASLFGDPFSFEVLKFLGGITVSPQQNAFLMQKVQLSFNFTLNFSIEELQNNFDELRRQLKSGLHLTPYENLYISLTNVKGSTVAPPTIVQCRVLLAFGINPSMSRIKQLAQTITGPHSENLGLNNTVFGRVKQVRLSSVFPHSLGSPSPAPLPSHHHRHRHHYHHHHHHHHQPDANSSPTISPAPRSAKSGPMAARSSPQSAPIGAPTPAQRLTRKTKPPSCHFGYKNRYPGNGNLHAPISPPTLAPHATSSPKQQPHRPATTVAHVPASSPLPNVVFARVRPPSSSEFDAEPPDLTPPFTPSPFSSSASIKFCDLRALPLFLLLVLHV